MSEKTYTTCDKCGRQINYRETVVTILKNIEQINHNIFTTIDEIEVIDSDELLTLCAHCGNLFNSEMFKLVLTTIPNIDNQNSN